MTAAVSFAVEDRQMGSGASAQAVLPMRLHVGGRQAKPGWTILNISDGPGVDIVGDCVDLSHLAAASVDEVYASHVYEHLGYQQELPTAFAHVFRVLKPGGVFRLSVPDLQVLCRLMLQPKLDVSARIHLMRMVYGGQIDAYDYHKCGFTFDIMTFFLTRAGFDRIRRVAGHGLFDDTSQLVVMDEPISLNVIAHKPG